MKLAVVKNMNHTLKPAFDSDLEKIKKLKVGEMYTVEVKKPRNVKFHRKFFALINMVFENQEVYDDIEKFRKDLTIAAGFYEEHVTFDGEIKQTAKSIAFHKMDDIEFSELYSKFIDTVIKIMGWDGQDIEENIQYFL